MKEVLAYVLIFANIISMVHLGLYVVGANVYDIKEFKRKKAAREQIQTAPQAKLQPLVSVVIPAYNERLGVSRTLDSIRRSSYRNIEIIVVNDGSKDNTAGVVRSYIAKQKEYITTSRMVRSMRSGRLYRKYTRESAAKLSIKLVNQTNQGKGAALNNAIANHVRGELVMALDADSVLDPYAIERAVRHFDNPDIIGIAANVRVMGGDNWLALLQRFEHMIGYRSKKFYTLSKSEFIVGGVASTYRTDVVKAVGMYDTDTQTEDIGLSLKLIAHHGNRQKRIEYAADVVAMTEGVQTYRALLKQRYRWKLGSLQNLFKYRALFFSGNDEKYTRRLTAYRLPMAILSELLLLAGPVMLGFIVYLSISRHTPGIILGAYITITLYTLWTIWPDEYLTNRQKAKMSLQGGVMYLLFYAMDLVQLAAVYRCIRNYKKVTFRTATQSTWVSPERAGATVR
ncbi:MAG TPA: glycosyltransferase [Candidatus Saccharimonadales bacterium]|jgi:cellulose synthase/poly-beta-1,6-N-acetylglucosamine synthase-like glycosyltransferase